MTLRKYIEDQYRRAVRVHGENDVLSLSLKLQIDSMNRRYPNRKTTILIGSQPKQSTKK